MLVARSVMLACTLLTGGRASQALAVPAPLPPPPESVLVTGAGVAWSDDGVLRTGSGVVMARDLAGPTPVGRDGWIAAAGRSALLAGRFGLPLSRVGNGPIAGDRGCRGWRADTGPQARPALTGVNGRGVVTRTAAFALAGRRLVLAGTAACSSETPSAPRPLFVRTLPDGRWRVLRHLPTRGELVLAANGRWLAVGVPAGAFMTASVYDRDGQRLRYRVGGLRPGHLELDAAGRLLHAAADYRPSFPVPDPALPASARYVASWASPSRPTVHPIAAVSDVPPVISDGRIALLERDPDTITGRLVVVDLVNGGTRAVIGVRRPYRSVYAVGLDGPRIAWVQSEVALPPPGSCVFGYAEGKPTLTGLDLSLAAPFAPAPAGPVPPAPGACGPPPP